MRLKYSFILLLLVTASCHVGRDYHRPDLQLPDQFRAGQQADTTLRALPEIRDFFKNQTLQALIDTAIAQNNDLKIAVKNIEFSQATLRKVRLNYLPDLNAQITANHNISSANSLAGIGNEQFIGSRSVEDFSANLGLTWEIDIWGRIRREKEEALSAWLQTEQVKRAVQTQLVANVSDGYYNLLMLDQQLEIARQSFQLSDSTLNIINAQYRVGEANGLAIRQAKAQLEVSAQLIPQIEQSIQIQENALSLLCGNYAKSITRSALPGNEFRDISGEGYPVSVLAARPDVHAAELGLRAANARVGINEALRYPTLTITASGGLNSFKASNWFSIPGGLFGTVAGGLVQPVFQRGRLKMQYQQAVIERDRAEITFKQTILQGYSQVSDALIRNEKLKEQSRAAENRQQALQEGISAANVLFRTGMVNYLEIITAENSYLQTRLTVTQLSREKAGAVIELYRALGGGWK